MLRHSFVRFLKKISILLLILFPTLSFGTEDYEKTGQRIETVSLKVKPWFLNISTGLQYDSNVILNPENSALPEGISRKSDWRAIAYLKGNYDLLRANNFKALAGYSFYQSLQKKLSAYNVTKHAFGLDAVYEFKWASLKGKYNFDYILAGGDKYSYSHSISPSLEISRDRFFGDLHYEHSWDHFTDSPRFTTNSERTGQDNLAGISLGVNISDSLAAMLGYDYNKNSAQQEYWEYTGNKISLTALARFPKRASVNLNWWLQKKDYDGINPAYNDSRKDTTQGYSASIKKELSGIFSVALGVAHARNDSNINAVEYKRTIYSLILTARY